MHYFFAVTIPANTLQNAPVTQILLIANAIITRVEIVIPPGSQGLSHLQVGYHGSQLYPLNPGASYIGDNTVYEWDEYQPIIVSPYQLIATAWNLDTVNPHVILIAITMLRPEEMGQEIPATSIAALSTLIGQEIPSG
jgi:hypothetical protein